MNDFEPVYEIHVDVAHQRPPRTDETRKYLINASSPMAAELLACQWAALSPGVVMAVGSRIIHGGLT